MGREAEVTARFNLPFILKIDSIPPDDGKPWPIGGVEAYSADNIV